MIQDSLCVSAVRLSFCDDSDDVASALGGVAGPLGGVVLLPGPSAVVNGGAGNFSASVIELGATAVAVVVVSGVVRARSGARAGSWGSTASLDLHVADGELGPVAGAGASVVPQPGGVATPVGDNEAHAVGEVVAHVVKVAAVTSHALLTTVLGHGGGESGELTGVISVEVDLGVEGKLGVDGVVVTGAVAGPFELVGDVLSALATLIAVVVVTLVVGRVTLVRGGGPGPLVGLHEVELGAPVAVNLVGVTVTPAVGVHPEGAIVVLAWHADEVEGGDAATLVVAEIDVPLDGATEEVGGEVLRVGVVEGVTLSDVSAAIGGHMVVGGRAAGEVGGDVVGLGLTIDLDGDLGETVLGVGVEMLANDVGELLVRVVLNGGERESGNEGLHL